MKLVTTEFKSGELERVCGQTQLCQLRCLMTILDKYMFRPLLANFRWSLKELKVLLYNVRAHIIYIVRP